MCCLHMWIIYRLWGFLLLKPALGVSQIPAQSTATQSRPLSAKSHTTPLYHCHNKQYSPDSPISPLWCATLLTSNSKDTHVRTHSSTICQWKGMWQRDRHVERTLFRERQAIRHRPTSVCSSAALQMSSFSCHTKKVLNVNWFQADCF